MRRVNSRLLSVSACSLLRGTRSRPASLRATNYLKLYGIIFFFDIEKGNIRQSRSKNRLELK